MAAAAAAGAYRAWLNTNPVTPAPNRVDLQNGFRAALRRLPSILLRFIATSFSL